MTTSEGTGARTITEHELAQCQRANRTGRQPVVFADHSATICWSPTSPWPGWPVSGP